MPLEFGPALTGDQQVRRLKAGRLPAGTFTDDTEMMLALAGSLLYSFPLDPDGLAARFVEWYRSDPPDIGVHTGQVLSAISQGKTWEKAVEEAQAATPTSASNGSVMRCFPVALAYHTDLKACLDASILQSMVTHPHIECRTACAFVNCVIWHALHGAGCEEAVRQAVADVHDMPVDLRRAIESAPSKGSADLPNSGWVRHTIESAVWALLNTGSFEEAVIMAGNLGNDADTTAAVTGAIAGALYGFESIPGEWRAALQGRWPPRTGPMYGTGDFVHIAEGLVELGSRVQPVEARG